MHMRTQKLAVSLAAATMFVAVLGASPALGHRVNCTDVRAALAEGKPIADIPESLGTTRARVEACTRIAEAQAERAERREALDARRAERRFEKTR